MDSTLAMSAEPDQVATCTQIGLLCTQSDPKLRPTMRQVVVMLSKKSGSLVEPTKPGYQDTKRRPHRPSASSSTSEGISSRTNSRSSKSTTTTTTAAGRTASTWAFGGSTSNAHHNHQLVPSFVSSVSDPYGKRPIEG